MDTRVPYRHIVETGKFRIDEILPEGMVLRMGAAARTMGFL